MTFLAWHFVGDTLRDGRAIPPDGVWLVHEGPVSICTSGLHASGHPFDALKYTPGTTLCRVECDDVVETQNDKFVCRKRKIVARMDATELLRYFARMQALSVIHLWVVEPPDVVLDYLMTGDEQMRAAAAGAARAARAAAAVAARAAVAAADATADAAAVAARAAAAAAAWAATEAADAAWAAAEAADAAAVAARDDFQSLVHECFGVGV